MPRNLFICFDGTNNQFGMNGNTNVVRLAQVLVRNPLTQLVYYDPGVGTLPEPGLFTRIGKELGRWWSLAFGTGLTPKVEEAYSYLIDFWEPGDRVFLFGFSRGAFSARVLAGMLHSLGLLPRGNVNLVPYVMRLFGGIRQGGASKFKELCDAFRWTFARPVDGDDERRFPVHFLGVWDTVSSVGWVWNPTAYPFTEHNPSVRGIRHAVSLDERRWFFRQNLMERSGKQSLKQHWFAGAHADVGGGYREDEGGLWRVAFEWMLTEAQNAGLQVDSQRLHTVLNKVQPPDRPWAEPKHDSLMGAWRLAEYVPKFSRQLGVRWQLFQTGKPRTVKPEALIDKAALMRIRGANYAPWNLSSAFLERVRTLQAVPDALPYHE